ncbi:unnamed protein product [Ectocarpus sp. 12 AP-2014]
MAAAGAAARSPPPHAPGVHAGGVAACSATRQPPSVAVAEGTPPSPPGDDHAGGDAAASVRPRSFHGYTSEPDDVANAVFRDRKVLSDTLQVNMLQTDSIVANARAFKALCLALLRPQEGIKALIPMCAGCEETIRAVRYHCHTCAKDWCRDCTNPEERRVTTTRCQKPRSHIKCRSCGLSKGLTPYVVVLTYMTMAPDPGR